MQRSKAKHLIYQPGELFLYYSLPAIAARILTRVRCIDFLCMMLNENVKLRMYHYQWADVFKIPFNLVMEQVTVSRHWGGWGQKKKVHMMHCKVIVHFWSSHLQNNLFFLAFWLILCHCFITEIGIYITKPNLISINYVLCKKKAVKKGMFEKELRSSTLSQNCVCLFCFTVKKWSQKQIIEVREL